jgi:nitrous oxide reductase accessory protein NosL
MKIIIAVLIYINLFAITSYTLAQKQKYIYPLGKKIYSFTCKDIKADDFASIEEFYNHIDKHCNLDEKRYKEALAYFLWDKHTTKKEIRFSYTKKDKCPVCGMFVYKYPLWVAMIKDKNHTYYFDGVKDMLKYYFDLDDTKGIKLYAQDYYTKEIFELHKAFFVVGSDVYGPMGDELIPFEKLSDAKRFKKDHFGNKIYKFDELDADIVWGLDE